MTAFIWTLSYSILRASLYFDRSSFVVSSLELLPQTGSVNYPTKEEMVSVIHLITMTTVVLTEEIAVIMTTKAGTKDVKFLGIKE